MNQIVLKDKFYEILTELDIPHPDTFVYDCKEKTPLTYDFEYPIIAKPQTARSIIMQNFREKRKYLNQQQRRAGANA